ncbi:MAG: hypothetical protein IPM34_12970 [Saprospiraceae bacterium]|nr:hypothetical protein [Saprospiraceae bacterium]
MAYDTNIFINCPFDKKYERILKALLFTCKVSGLEPQLSNRSDSGSVRINTIITKIKLSKYSIHDLSRMQTIRKFDFVRFNMPFELGLDLGVKATGNRPFKDKKCLIIDIEKYRYQKALSDLSGNDISSYGKKNQIQNAIKILRDWFTIILNPIQKPAHQIFQEYFEFLAELQTRLMNLNYSKRDIENLTHEEFCHYVKEWLNERKV